MAGSMGFGVARACVWGAIAVVAGVGLGLAGCGGRVEGGASDDGGPGDDAIVSVDAGPPVILDAGPPPSFDSGPPVTIDDAGPAPDAPIEVLDSGSCLVDLEPCLSAAQCCSGECTMGACGPGISPPPTCFPDGDPCMSATDCCSGTCGAGICGAVPPPDDAAPPIDAGPPACTVPVSNACMACLQGVCCSQLAACEDDPQCSLALSCFESCFAPGSGNTCSQQCNAMYPSPFEQPLTQCGATSCLPSCE